jgi:hypothetical protein
MQLRPPARLLAATGALVLATVLTSCGFDYATDRVYTPAAGSNDRSADVDVLGASVVSGQEGSGTFIASFANNDELEDATVVSLAGAGDDADLTVASFSAITVPAGQLVNLATSDGGIVVTGDLGPGGSVRMTIGFGDDETVTLDVPVVAPCDEFEGLDKSGDGGETFNCEIATPEIAD